MIPRVAVSQTALPGWFGAAGSHGPAQRVRVVLLDRRPREPVVDEHVRVRLCEEERPEIPQTPEPPEATAAWGDVLIKHGTGPRQALHLARCWPGALVVAVHDHDRCWLRLGPEEHLLELRADGVRRPEREWEFVASLAHSCLVAGLPVAVLVSAAGGARRRSGPGLLGLQTAEPAEQGLGLARP
ncbi:hypothetical protein ACIRA2_34980 [Streptomyces griseoviridis]